MATDGLSTQAKLNDNSLVWRIEPWGMFKERSVSIPVFKQQFVGLICFLVTGSVLWCGLSRFVRQQGIYLFSSFFFILSMYFALRKCLTWVANCLHNHNPKFCQSWENLYPSFVKRTRWEGMRTGLKALPVTFGQLECVSHVTSASLSRHHVLSSVVCARALFSRVAIFVPTGVRCPGLRQRSALTHEGVAHVTTGWKQSCVEM